MRRWLIRLLLGCLSRLLAQLLGCIARLLSGLLRGVGQLLLGFGATCSLRQLLQLLGGLLSRSRSGLRSFRIRLPFQSGFVQRLDSILGNVVRIQQSGHMGEVLGLVACSFQGGRIVLGCCHRFIRELRCRTAGAVLVQRSLRVGQRVLLAKLGLILKLLAGLGELFLRLLLGQQALAIWLLTLRHFRILRSFCGLMQCCLGFVNSDERGIVLGLQALTSISSTTSGLTRDATQLFRVPLEALAKIITGTVEMLGALGLRLVLGIGIKGLVEGLAEVVCGLADLLFHPLQIALLILLNFLQGIQLLTEVLMREQGRPLLLLPLRALRLIAIAIQRGLREQRLLTREQLRGLRGDL